MGVIAPDGQAPKSNRIGNAKMHSRSQIGFDVSGREAAQLRQMTTSIRWVRQYLRNLALCIDLRER